MKKISEVHGTFTSFADLANAFGMKPKAKKEEPRKCSNCGGTLTKRGNTNVYACEFCKLEDRKLKDGKEVQVFSPCGNIFIDKA